MDVVINYRTSAGENASRYYNKVKVLKRKLEGAKKAVAAAEQERERIEAEPKKEIKIVKKRVRVWYEKFKWFFASNGMLVIGGRDATTNEIVVKKHTLQEDIVFHTEAPGSPFVIIKTEGKDVPKEVMEEAAQFCASHSKAWKLGLGSVEVYSVAPDQVTKKAQSGEYVPKGGFMIYGKRTYYTVTLGLCCGMHEGVIMCAPCNSIKGKRCVLTPGNNKKSDAAKTIVHHFKEEGIDLDDVIHILPGDCEVVCEK